MGEREIDYEANDSDLMELNTEWEAFRVRLLDYLEVMTVDEDGSADHLIVELPGDDTADHASPYAQFASFAEGERLRAEVVGDAFLPDRWRTSASWTEGMCRVQWQGNDEAEPNWFQEVSRPEITRISFLVVDVLRERFGIAHPALLSFSAFGPSSSETHLLGLVATEDVVSDRTPGKRTLPPKPAPPAAPEPPEDFEEPGEVPGKAPETAMQLSVLVARLLTQMCRSTVEVLGPDFTMSVDGHDVAIAIGLDEPRVDVTGHALEKVRSARLAAVEVGLLNRDQPGRTWFLDGRDVYVRRTLPAGPFHEDTLRALLDDIAEALDADTRDLALRTGGRTPVAE